MKDLAQALQELTGLIESRALRYVVMGGLAVRVHGIPRPTYDIDFTVAIKRSDLPGLFSAVEALGYTVADAYKSGWVDEVSGLPLVKFGLYFEDGAIDIDVFLAESPFQEEVLKRAQRHPIDGYSVWLVTPEDLILLKLLANRPRDIADIGDILFTQGALDESYLRRWADGLALSERLDQVLRDRQEG
jgi:predicted nucleotidyltransferase